jgi:hypothetical protein
MQSMRTSSLRRYSPPQEGSVDNGGGGGLIPVYSNELTVNGAAGNLYLLDGTTVFNLPAGVDGDRIGLVDYEGTFEANPLTIYSDGNDAISVEDLPSLDISSKGAALQLVFYGGRWVFYGMEDFVDELSVGTISDATTNNGASSDTVWASIYARSGL